MTKADVQGRLNRETNPIPGERPGFNPQFIDSDGYATDVTPNTPFPSGSYVQTDAGVWVPQKGNNDGAAHVQLTGSNVKVIRYGEELVIPPGVMSYVPATSLTPDVLNKRYAVAIKLTGVSTPNRKFEVLLNYRRYNEGVKDGSPRYLMAVETVITATGETGTPTTFVSPLKFVPAEWFNVGIINNADVDITLSWYIVEV